MPLTEQEKANLSLKRGKLAAGISDPAERRRFISAQGEADRHGGSDAEYLPVMASAKKAEVNQALGVQPSEPDRTQDFAKAIATAEGYGKKGTIPTVKHNPGDLKLKGNEITAFPNEQAGFRALHHQIQAIDKGKSHVYTPDMTLQDMARKYTTTNPDEWANNVAKAVHATPVTPISEVLHGPIPVLAPNSPEGLYNTAQHEAGHAVVDETLMPGSVDKMGIDRRTGGGVTDLHIRPVGGESDLVNYLGGSLAGAEVQPDKEHAVLNASGDLRGRTAVIGGQASTPLNNLHRLITGGAGSNDIMVRAPQLMANAQARIQPILADPIARQQMADVGSKVNENTVISGNDVRQIMKAKPVL
jgi:hypothetical protein